MSWEEREPRIWWMGLKEGKTKSFEKKIVEMKPKQNLDIYREGQERCDRKGMQKHPSCTRKTKKNNKKTFLCTVECAAPYVSAKISHALGDVLKSSISIFVILSEFQVLISKFMRL